jgi:formate hydrogenlyase subunit 3/multisubunit Na+/H+ antiporter MnhD subunit
MGLHYFSFVWLHLSMLLVCMLRDGLSFLIAWEIMSLASFFLVIFESEKTSTIKYGIQYLIQMHIGFAFLLVAFLISGISTGEPVGFESLEKYFSTQAVFPLFLLFFIGFGIKAGFIPFHTWLPHAHPAAPSHVSGIMSGVMIKMGIYGIIRVLTFIHTDLLEVGIFLLIISFISGVIGVILAIVQHDIKKLLAYHSIENIGIIGIGIGVGVIGLATENFTLAALGLAGGFLHILNHSLFKSLLFYTAGNIYQQTHTRNIEKLGGLIKKMPKTALFFLLGSVAISGLPPFNGFISEFLIYLGMFKDLHTGDLLLSLLLLGGIVGLVIIGGLAIYCFTKVFSVVFLGNPRSFQSENAKEPERSMFIPKYLIGFFIVLIGLLPVLVLKPLTGVVSVFTPDVSALTAVAPSLQGITISLSIFILVIGALWLVRKWITKTKTIETGPTWGCGYTGANPAVHQYTATSYADYIGNLAKYITGSRKRYKTIEKDEIFPAPRKFETHSSDVFEDYLVSKPSGKLLKFLDRIAVFQTGNIQHYLLYAIVFMLLILVLTILNLV